jgi:hypothetical protein
MICRIYRMFSLTSYASTKCTWGRKEYSNTWKTGESMTWWSLGMWKLKGYGEEAIKELCPMWSELEDAKHVTLGCGETVVWRMSLNIIHS